MNIYIHTCVVHCIALLCGSLHCATFDHFQVIVRSCIYVYNTMCTKLAYESADLGSHTPHIHTHTTHTHSPTTLKVFCSYPALSCPARPCPALPCPTLPCPALSCPALKMQTNFFVMISLLNFNDYRFGFGNPRGWPMKAHNFSMHRIRK